MLEEPLASNSSEENYLVTAVISHVVKPGRDQGYEAWFHGIAADARKFKGHLGVSTIRPQHHAHPEYVVILKFDCYNNLKNWLESDVRREWIERLQPLIEKPEDIQTLTGLETWFTLPNKSMKAPPPRYKMALVTWLGVFVTISILNRLLVPLLSWLPALARQTENRAMNACKRTSVSPSSSCGATQAALYYLPVRQVSVSVRPVPVMEQ